MIKKEKKEVIYDTFAAKTPITIPIPSTQLPLFILNLSNLATNLHMGNLN